MNGRLNLAVDFDQRMNLKWILNRAPGHSAERVVTKVLEGQNPRSGEIRKTRLK